MPLYVIREDLTKVVCDAIVNPTNNNLDGSGGVDAIIHTKAGEKINLDCAKIGYCATGDAVITKGYELSCKYVIHTVGPKWIDGLHNERFLLRSCYNKCLELAKKHKCKSVAFPVISTGSYAFSKEEGFTIAVKIIQDFLLENEMDVYLVVFNRDITYISKKLFNDVKEYIDDYYEDNTYSFSNRSISIPDDCFAEMTTRKALPKIYKSKKEKKINEIIIELDISFSEMLIKLIDEKGMKDSECYKKANVDRKLFNKIKNNSDYHPKKETALAFAIALELNLKETQNLLSKAGYVLSNSHKFDVIIKYFIENGIYDVMLINETLYSFDQKLLTN